MVDGFLDVYRKTMGNKLHESRHGGQHSRGEINAVTQSFGELGLDAEVSAYRAQFSWDGTLQYMTHDFDQTGDGMRLLLNNKVRHSSFMRTVNSMNQINVNMVLGIGEFVTGRNGEGTYILPIYSPGSINNNN